MAWVCIVTGLPVIWLLICVWPLGQRICIVKKYLSLNAVLQQFFICITNPNPPLIHIISGFSLQCLVVELYSQRVEWKSKNFKTRRVKTFIQCSTDSYDFKYLPPVALLTKLSIIITFLRFSSYRHILLQGCRNKPFPSSFPSQ